MTCVCMHKCMHTYMDMCIHMYAYGHLYIWCMSTCKEVHAGRMYLLFGLEICTYVCMCVDRIYMHVCDAPHRYYIRNSFSQYIYDRKRA